MDDAFTTRTGAIPIVRRLEAAHASYVSKVNAAAFMAEMQKWQAESVAELRHTARIIRTNADALDTIADKMEATQ